MRQYARVFQRAFLVGQLALRRSCAVKFRDSSIRTVSYHSAFVQRGITLAKNDATSAPVLDVDDTIFALATPPGRSAIAIIRISGPQSLVIHHALCPGQPPLTPRRATLCTLIQPSTQSHLDTCIALYFPGPHSATGQDILELHVHGSPATIRATLRAISSLSLPPQTPNRLSAPAPAIPGAIRYAEPGEFTRRAVLNGRLDLTQAESLGALLAAETETQRAQAIRATSGSGSSSTPTYERWRTMLISARSELEALLDFADDSSQLADESQLVARVTLAVRRLRDRVRVHVANARRGELLRGGLRVTLLGEPNVGKSSLLNLVVGREAAIVSAEAGTTRDVLGVTVDLGGYAVRFEDLAGVRDAAVGEVEREGIRRAKHRVGQSDVVVVVFALQQESGAAADGLAVNSDILALAKQAYQSGSRVVMAVNKADLCQSAADAEAVLAQLGERCRKASLPESIPKILISCHQAADSEPSVASMSNLQHLLDALIAEFTDLTKPEEYTAAADSTTTDIVSAFGGSDWLATRSSEWADSMAASERQRLLLQETAHFLDSYLALAKEGTPVCAGEDQFDLVLAAEHLRLAADSLARITGRGDAGDVEDILGAVFEKFCIGK